MRKLLFPILAVMALLPTAALAGRPAVSPAAVAEITAREDAPLLLDVRSPEEYAKGHVPGAELIPHDQLAGRLDEIDRDRWVLVYCHSGKRATTAQEILEDAGFEVRQIQGSWKRWQEEDRPVVVPSGAEAAR